MPLKKHRAPLLATVALFPSPLLAQETAAAGDDERGETIIVTAQKIEQRAKDVPITISALTGDAIDELGVTDLDELSNYVPGLNIQEQSANNPGIVIRGITSDSGSAQQGPRVTLYYNGVDISRSRGSYQAIYDLERVEVIKGPQATLFGTASAVGAISLVSAKPKSGASAALTGGYGNFDATLLSGFVNLGSDTVAGRVAFEWRTRDGYVQNLAESQDEDLYAKDQFGVRGSLRFTPSPYVTVDVIGTYDQQRHGGTPFISGTFPAYAGAPGGAQNAFGDANLGGSPFSAEALGDDQLGLNREVYDINLTAQVELSDSLTFTTVNGYRKFDSAEVFDADGSAAPFLEFAEIAEGDQISHEGRFSYADPSWRAAFGWNFFTEDGRQNVPFSTEEGTFLQCLTGLFGVPDAGRPFGGLPCVAADGSVPSLGLTNIPYTSVFENQGKNSSYSLFGDVTYIAAPNLELTAGARVLIEERRSSYFADVPNSVLSGAPLVPGQADTGGTITTEDSFSAVLPRFNVLYRINPAVNVFATVSKGRRSPVVPVNAAGVQRVIPEETVWNYEGGLKLSSGPVSGSLGVYYQVYDNFQVSVAEVDGEGNPTGSFVTESAGSASNLGVEAEVALKASDWLRVFGNVGYIAGGIDEDGAFSPEYSGARFRLQPEWQAAGGFTIDYPLAEGMRLFATPSVTYRSRIFFEVPNDPVISQGPVTLVNARAGVSFADDRFELAGFIRNAFDEDYLLDAGNTGGAFGIPTFIPAEPRFYGIQLTARFGD
ncbi:MAG: TonB-dependent receptor [Altererythrobacter sp.]|nr:TonB-dependent receptor [Altererythrobacter sp.]|tara:strand:+ start:1099 stop:3414 length:2316 start_codon:yes stop_codon:yes gene_type:complete